MVQQEHEEKLAELDSSWVDLRNLLHGLCRSEQGSSQDGDKDKENGETDTDDDYLPKAKELIDRS